MYSGPVIDIDVHHDWSSPSELLPYLSSGWREFVGGVTQLGGRSGYPVTPFPLWPHPVGAYRNDAFAEDGTVGADYEILRTQLLEAHNIERAILSFGSGAFVSALPNPYFAAEVARASNDWSIEKWLNGKDDRLYGALLVGTQLPDIAAQEIRRVGAHPKLVEVLLTSNGIGRPFGHPLFHPIYEAAVEFDLPIGLHIGGEAFGPTNAAATAGGLPSLYIEQHSLVAQAVITHLMSMIVHGVFEKFPSLRVAVIEAGVAWVPWFLWRLDSEYKALRRETPWLKRLPSEYFRDHVRVSTQPLEQSPNPQHLIDLLSSVDAENFLCFATDYPHWDSDETTFIANRIPKAWWPKVFYENAMEFYGWSKGGSRHTGSPRAAVSAASSGGSQ